MLERTWKVEQCGLWEAEKVLNDLEEQGYSIWTVQQLPPEASYPGGPVTVYVAIIVWRPRHMEAGGGEEEPSPVADGG